jgi:hypothetical protein
MMIAWQRWQWEGLMRRMHPGRGIGMKSVLRIQDFAVGGAAAVRLYLQTRPDSGALFWKINGFRAKLLVWTTEEWEKLERRPPDAQFHPSGVWCALRLDEAG